MSGRIFELCAVRDSALAAFASVMTFQTVAAGVRSFRDEVQRAESPMHAHPEDYELWRLGQYDEDTGEITPCRPEMVVRAKDLMEK